MKESRLCTVFRIATKRKHNEVTLTTKYEALKEFEKNRPNKEVAIQFNVPGSTLATWKKNKEKIYQAFQNSLLKRQRVKIGTYEKINDALLEWLTSTRGNNIPVNGPILLEKALESAKALNYGDLLISKLTRIINHRRRDKMRQSSISNFFKQQ